MATRSRQLTAEDLYHLPDDGNRYELVDGELRVMAPGGFEHSDVSGVIAARIGAFVLDRRLGRVLTAEPGFVLARNPDVVLSPDFAFVSAGRLPSQKDRPKFAELAPDFAVEVVSPSDRPSEVATKARRWIDAGVRLVWVVHPQRRNVTVYEPGGVVRVIGEDGELEGGDVLPGFRLAVAELFQ